MIVCKYCNADDLQVVNEYHETGCEDNFFEHIHRSCTACENNYTVVVSDFVSSH